MFVCVCARTHIRVGFVIGPTCVLESVPLVALVMYLETTIIVNLYGEL